MFSKNDQWLKNWCNFKHQSSVVPKEFNVGLVARIEEYWSTRWIEPTVFSQSKIGNQSFLNLSYLLLFVITSDQISLFKCPIVNVIEMVDVLIYVIGCPWIKCDALVDCFFDVSNMTSNTLNTTSHAQNNQTSNCG